MAPLFEMQNVEKHFGTVIALGGVNFSVSEGECHCLLGDNGAGKSTLIKTMSGVHTPTSGRLLMRGQTVHFEDPRQAMQQGIATVYQDLAMIPLMSVSRNFFMGNEPVKKWLGFDLVDHEQADQVERERGGHDVGHKPRADVPRSGLPWSEVDVAAAIDVAGSELHSEVAQEEEVGQGGGGQRGGVAPNLGLKGELQGQQQHRQHRSRLAIS